MSNIDNLAVGCILMYGLKLVSVRKRPFDMNFGPKLFSKTDEYALSLDPQCPHLLGLQPVFFCKIVGLGEEITRRLAYFLIQERSTQINALIETKNDWMKPTADQLTPRQLH